LGNSKSEQLETELGTLENVRKVTVEDLCKLDDIQEKTATYIVEGLKSRSDLIEDLLTVGVEIIKSEKSSEVSGKTFVITGTLGRPRKAIETLLKSKGGKTSSSVSSKTSFLVCNEASSSTKYKKALDLGISIIKEDELIEMLGGDTLEPKEEKINTGQQELF